MRAAARLVLALVALAGLAASAAPQSAATGTTGATGPTGPASGKSHAGKATGPTGPSADTTRDDEAYLDHPVRLADARPDPPPVALVHGTIHPVASPDIPRGTVLLKHGRIEAIQRGEGDSADVLRARGYQVVDCTGRHVYPGLVAVGAAQVGLGQDAGGSTAAEVLAGRIADSFDPWSDDVELMDSVGITTALVYRWGSNEGGGIPVTGRGGLVKMSWKEPRGTALKDPAALFATQDLVTSAGRQAFMNALKDARKACDRHEFQADKDPVSALLCDVGSGRLPLFVPADDAGSAATVADVARQTKARLVLYHSTEAWAVAPRLASAHVAAVQHVRMSWGKARGSRRTETPGGWRFDAVKRLVDAGVTTVISPLDDGLFLWGVAGRDLANFPLEASFAERGGLDAGKALEAITLGPARLLGVADRIGSLETGKDADVIVTDGDILDYRTFVRLTLVNGFMTWRAEGDPYWSWALARRAQALGETGSLPPPAEP